MRGKMYNSYRPILDNYKKGLKQQLFLEKYVEEHYESITRFLLYHGIGTGKTRSSIIIAEKIMAMNPKMKALIILPARLRTNYIDELIPVICADYKQELIKYNDEKTSEQNKKKLRLIFNAKIKQKYTIESYERITNEFKNSKDINKTLQEYTKNKIIIIDEFHNLISNYESEENIETIYKMNKIPPTIKFTRSLIMRFISRYADKTCKMFFLTATPVFDNYNQFVELVKLLNVKPFEDAKYTSLRDLIPYIKDKVSYYSDENRIDFPEVEYKIENIPLTKTQDIKTKEIQDNDNKDENNETFLLKQRQISISVYGFEYVDKILKNLTEYAPKLKLLFEYLVSPNTGKHLVFSNFITYCLYIIKKYLDNNGWINYTDINKIKDYNPYKTYVLWDASLNDANKQSVKSVLNSIENMDGKIIKVILGSPSIKEGISFKHIQHLHQIDPVWNSSAKDQVEGRCIRYKSHLDIPLNHSYLNRKVIIHNYKSVGMKGGKITETCDEKIYDKIMPAKHVLVNKITKLLQKVAIDYYLYKKLANIPIMNNTSSDITIKSSDNIGLIKRKTNGKTKEVKVKNTCPKIRIPINGKCKTGYEIKTNAQNNQCCYKIRNVKNDCPKTRQPINNECPKKGFILVKTKNGEACCEKEKKIVKSKLSHIQLDNGISYDIKNKSSLTYNTYSIYDILNHLLDHGWIPIPTKNKKFSFSYENTEYGSGFVINCINNNIITNYNYKYKNRYYYALCKVLIKTFIVNSKPVIAIPDVIHSKPNVVEDTIEYWFDDDVTNKNEIKANKKKISQLLTDDMPIIKYIVDNYDKLSPETIKIDKIDINKLIITCSYTN